MRGEGGEWEGGGGKVVPSRLREVQAFSKFLRLDHLGIAALEASRIQRFRLVGNQSEAPRAGEFAAVCSLGWKSAGTDQGRKR